MPLGSVAMAVQGEGDLEPWDLYELAIVAAVFGTPQPDLADPWYELRMCAVSGDPGARGFGHGFAVTARHTVADLVTADTVIVPSVPRACAEGRSAPDPALIAALKEAHANGARLVGLCDGVFALAEAGLLDGRRVAVHWERTATFARLYPYVAADDAVLYVDDGDVLTSAGMTAGLDLCLHLVRRDLGAAVANRLARRMVVAPHRPGGQVQFVDRSVPADDGDGLGPVLAWAAANLRRHFGAYLGVPPGAYRRAFHVTP